MTYLYKTSVGKLETEKIEGQINKKYWIIFFKTYNKFYAEIFNDINILLHYDMLNVDNTAYKNMEK